MSCVRRTSAFVGIAIVSACLFTPTALAARAPASFSLAQAVLLASSSPSNAYTAGVSVVLAAPVAGDFLAIGGSAVAAAPVAGDAFLFAGSVSSRAKVVGDLRAAGGNITIDESVGGDLVALGLSVRDTGRASGSIFIVAPDVSLVSGAAGPVVIYGNNVSLAGSFSDDVTIIASGHVSLAASTTINGTLSYKAPEEIEMPESVVVHGGITYTSFSYLPDAGASRLLSFISVWFFLLVRILGALILAGLLAGLFPRLAEIVAERAYTLNVRSILLTLLLGFAVFVATPILLVLLSLTFVGIGIALLIAIGYAFLFVLSLLYAGILLGSIIVHSYSRREVVRWYDGVFGMLALSLLAFVPVIGVATIFLLALFSAGALLITFFTFAFPHVEDTSELV